MRTLIIPGLMFFVLITAPSPTYAESWMTYHDWFYVKSFRMPKDAYEADELREQLTREEKTLREAYIRGVIDTLLLLSTTKTDNEEMVKGMKDLTAQEMSGLVTQIYEKQPQYRKKPVIFVLGYVMPQVRARLGKPQKEQLKSEEIIESP